MVVKPILLGIILFVTIKLLIALIKDIKRVVLESKTKK